MLIWCMLHYGTGFVQSYAILHKCVPFLQIEEAGIVLVYTRYLDSLNIGSKNTRLCLVYIGQSCAEN